MVYLRALAISVVSDKRYPVLWGTHGRSCTSARPAAVATKINLARQLRGRPDGMFVAPFEQGEIGPDLFRQVCKFGLEGLVSKRGDRHYRGGRSPHWIKVKNRQHHAFERVKVSFA